MTTRPAAGVIVAVALLINTVSADAVIAPTNLNR